MMMKRRRRRRKITYEFPKKRGRLYPGQSLIIKSILKSEVYVNIFKHCSSVRNGLQRLKNQKNKRIGIIDERSDIEEKMVDDL